MSNLDPICQHIFPVARAAFRFILRRIKGMVNDGEKCQNLVLITGVGNKKLSDQVGSDGDSLFIPTRDGTLREYIRQIMRHDFRPSPTVLTLGDGMVQVTSYVLKT
jgi:hypothetical protein